MLDLPHLVEPELVGEDDLFDGLVEDAVLGVVIPWLEDGVLVEDAEFHWRFTPGGRKPKANDYASILPPDSGGCLWRRCNW